MPLHLGFDSDHHDVLAKADIKWSCDSDAVSLRSFAGNDAMSFNNGVLLLLQKVGKAKVTAVLDGVSYTCFVTVREPITANSDDDLNFYIGDLHNHTTKIHNRNDFITRTSEFQYEFIDKIKSEGRIDFCAMSDHAGILNDTEFFRIFTEVEKAEPSSVVIFPGSESDVTVLEPDRFDVPHKNSGEIVTLNTDRYGNFLSWEHFHNYIKSTTEPVAIFAHPNVIGFSTNGIWNFCFHKNNAPEMLRAVRGIETINGSAVSENLMHEFNYSLALDYGFKVSPVASSDSHGPIWGYNASPSKTVILAKEKSREAFLDALRHNRFYATESGNIKLRYSVNGKWAPCDLNAATSYKFHVELSYFNDDKSTRAIECSIISDGGKTVKKLTNISSLFDFEIESDSARYFYLRLVDSAGRRTWSMPVWTGRKFNTYVEPNITPIDLSEATAVDILTGCDASVTIDGNVYNTWEAKTSKASILIDLKGEYDICALGNYPRIVARPSKADKTEVKANWHEDDYTATIPTAFEIYTSLDGTSYEKQSEGIFRMFGGENIVTFERTRARYIRLDILSTIGADSIPHLYGNAKCSIGNLTVFE